MSAASCYNVISSRAGKVSEEREGHRRRRSSKDILMKETISYQSAILRNDVHRRGSFSSDLLFPVGFYGSEKTSRAAATTLTLITRHTPGHSNSQSDARPSCCGEDVAVHQRELVYAQPRPHCIVVVILVCRDCHS